MSRLFRRLAHAPLNAVEVNGALRVMLGAARDTSCLRDCPPTVETADVVIAGMTRIRVPEARAITTVLSNTGTTAVNIFEDRQLLFILPAGESYQLPLRGQHVLHGDAVSGHIVATTYLRCQCAHPEQPYTSGGEVEPIGAFLL